MGYPEGTKGYKLNDLSTKSFIHSRDIVFGENKFHHFEGKHPLKKDLSFHCDPVYTESFHSFSFHLK